MDAKKRKREADPPRITFITPSRTFERLLKETSLEALYSTVKKKLGLDASSVVELSQVRDGKPIDLEDEDDFDALRSYALSNDSVQVKVSFPGALEILQVSNQVEVSAPTKELSPAGTKKEKKTSHPSVEEASGPPSDAQAISSALAPPSVRKEEPKLKKHDKVTLSSVSSGIPEPQRDGSTEVSKAEAREKPKSKHKEAKLTVPVASTSGVQVEDLPYEKASKKRKAVSETAVFSTSVMQDVGSSAEKTSKKKSVKFVSDTTSKTSSTSAVQVEVRSSEKAPKKKKIVSVVPESPVADGSLSIKSLKPSVKHASPPVADAQPGKLAAERFDSDSFATPSVSVDAPKQSTSTSVKPPREKKSKLQEKVVESGVSPVNLNNVSSVSSSLPTAASKETLRITKKKEERKEDIQRPPSPKITKASSKPEKKKKRRLSEVNNGAETGGSVSALKEPVKTKKRRIVNEAVMPPLSSSNACITKTSNGPAEASDGHPVSTEIDAPLSLIPTAKSKAKPSKVKKTKAPSVPEGSASDVHYIALDSVAGDISRNSGTPSAAESWLPDDVELNTIINDVLQKVHQCVSSVHMALSSITGPLGSATITVAAPAGKERTDVAAVPRELGLPEIPSEDARKEKNAKKKRKDKDAPETDIPVPLSSTSVPGRDSNGCGNSLEILSTSLGLSASYSENLHSADLLAGLPEIVDGQQPGTGVEFSVGSIDDNGPLSDKTPKKPGHVSVDRSTGGTSQSNAAHHRQVRSDHDHRHAIDASTDKLLTSPPVPASPSLSLGALAFAASGSSVSEVVVQGKDEGSSSDSDPESDAIDEADVDGAASERSRDFPAQSMLLETVQNCQARAPLALGDFDLEALLRPKNPLSWRDIPSSPESGSEDEMEEISSDEEKEEEEIREKKPPRVSLVSRYVSSTPSVDDADEDEDRETPATGDLASVPFDDSKHLDESKSPQENETSEKDSDGSAAPETAEEPLERNPTALGCADSFDISRDSKPAEAGPPFLAGVGRPSQESIQAVLPTEYADEKDVLPNMSESVISRASSELRSKTDELAKDELIDSRALLASPLNIVLNTAGIFEGGLDGASAGLDTSSQSGKPDSHIGTPKLVSNGESDIQTSVVKRQEHLSIEQTPPPPTHCSRPCPGTPGTIERMKDRYGRLSPEKKASSNATLARESGVNSNLRVGSAEKNHGSFVESSPVTVRPRYMTRRSLSVASADPCSQAPTASEPPKSTQRQRKEQTPTLPVVEEMEDESPGIAAGLRRRKQKLEVEVIPPLPSQGRQRKSMQLVGRFASLGGSTAIEPSLAPKATQDADVDVLKPSIDAGDDAPEPALRHGIGNYARVSADLEGKSASTTEVEGSINGHAGDGNANASGSSSVSPPAITQEKSELLASQKRAHSPAASSATEDSDGTELHVYAPRPSLKPIRSLNDIAARKSLFSPAATPCPFVLSPVKSFDSQALGTDGRGADDDEDSSSSSDSNTDSDGQSGIPKEKRAGNKLSKPRKALAAMISFFDSGS